MKKTNWNKIRKNVRKLQVRIAKAVGENNWRKVKSLSKLLTNSFSAKQLAILKVVTNKGKRTAGVDKEIWTKEDIISKTKALKRRGYKPLPLKRIYIPKKNGKKTSAWYSDHERQGNASITSFGIRADSRMFGRPKLVWFQDIQSLQRCFKSGI